MGTQGMSEEDELAAAIAASMEQPQEGPSTSARPADKGTTAAAATDMDMDFGPSIARSNGVRPAAEQEPALASTSASPSSTAPGNAAMNGSLNGSAPVSTPAQVSCPQPTTPPPPPPPPPRPPRAVIFFNVCKAQGIV